MPGPGLGGPRGWEFLTEEEKQKFTEREIEFLKTKRDMTDFKVGVVIPSTLKARQIEGGVVLYDNDFTMRA